MTTPDADLPSDVSRDADGGDLDWLAFCYLAGEMDAVETAAFEQRLAACQFARERLAAAVALAGCIAACKSEPEAPSLVEPAGAVAVTSRRDAKSGSFWRPVAWLSVAAAMLLAAIWFHRRPGDDDTTTATPNSESVEVQLAATWASLLDDHDEGAIGETPDLAATTDADESAAAPLVFEPSAAAIDEPLDAPDWMLAALGGEGVSMEPGTVDSQADYDDVDRDMNIDGDAAGDEGTHDG